MMRSRRGDGSDLNGRGQTERGDVLSKPICGSLCTALPHSADRRRRKTAKMSRAHAERRPAAMVLSAGANPLGTKACSFV